jgi:hypothetical protein
MYRRSRGAPCQRCPSMLSSGLVSRREAPTLPCMLPASPAHIQTPPHHHTHMCFAPAVRALSSSREAVLLLDLSRPTWPIQYVNERWCASTGERRCALSRSTAALVLGCGAVQAAGTLVSVVHGALLPLGSRRVAAGGQRGHRLLLAPDPA